MADKKKKQFTAVIKGVDKSQPRNCTMLLEKPTDGGKPTIKLSFDSELDGHFECDFDTFAKRIYGLQLNSGITVG